MVDKTPAPGSQMVAFAMVCNEMYDAYHSGSRAERLDSRGRENGNYRCRTPSESSTLKEPRPPHHRPQSRSASHYPIEIKGVANPPHGTLSRGPSDHPHRRECCGSADRPQFCKRRRNIHRRLYAVDFKGGRAFGEPQLRERIAAVLYSCRTITMCK